MQVDCNNYEHSLHTPTYTKLLFILLKFEFCFNIEFIDRPKRLSKPKVEKQEVIVNAEVVKKNREPLQIFSDKKNKVDTSA